jgi:hypothetical protein
MRLLYLLLILVCKISISQCYVINASSLNPINCNGECTTLSANYSIFSGTNTYGVSTIPYNPASYTSGTLYSIPIDDRWSAPISLPFNFCFFGQTYSQLLIGTNGVISFNLAYSNLYCPWPFTATIPNSNATPPPGFPRPMIGLYHDINPSVASNPTDPCQPNCGEVRYGVEGVYPCRRFVISYNNIPHYTCVTLRSKFQIILYELTNIIEIQVERKQTCGNWNGGRACLGIQNSAGTVGYTPPGRNTSNWTVTTPEAWRFTPNSPSASNFGWYNLSGNLISQSPQIQVCPSVTTSYVAMIQSCQIQLSDTVQVIVPSPFITGPIYKE